MHRHKKHHTINRGAPVPRDFQSQVGAARWLRMPFAFIFFFSFTSRIERKEKIILLLIRFLNANKCDPKWDNLSIFEGWGGARYWLDSWRNPRWHAAPRPWASHRWALCCGWTGVVWTGCRRSRPWGWKPSYYHNRLLDCWSTLFFFSSLFSFTFPHFFSLSLFPTFLVALVKTYYFSLITSLFCSKIFDFN